MAAPFSSPLPPLQSTPHRHRKRVSVSRLSSDTIASLPPYRSIALSRDSSEQPPDYPDSAEEADEETDDQVPQLLSPPISPRPRRRKLLRTVSQPRTANFYGNPSSQSDIFLDRILERSVAALELSNSLLQSSMSTQSSLSTVFSPELSSPEQLLDYRARQLTDRIHNNHGMHERWMDDLDILTRDVEALHDEEPHYSTGVGRVNVPGRLKVPHDTSDAAVSRSLPSASCLPRKSRRRSSFDLRNRGTSDCGRLRLTSDQRALSAPAPRAMTQYVNANADLGDLLESSSDVSSILLPSTNGLRSSSTVSNFSSPSLTTLSPPPACSSAYASLARQASRSPSRSPSASGSSSRTYRQRSRSRSSNQPPSPHLLPRIIPPPILELPSQSDSSSSDSPHPSRTLESLRKILDEQPPMSSESKDAKGKHPEGKSSRPPPAFLPRSPPVGPVSSTSTTTTSISRLYTKGSHSTSTRPRSPPRQSSLKHRPPPLDTVPSASTTSISSLRSPVSKLSSTTSSGRSTPRSVAFGPLPEPIRPEGAPSRFKEQREAKAKSKARSRSGSRSGKDRKGSGKNSSGKEKDEESSWWTTWLTGGSALSMSASRNEERVEDRMARSWGRPGMGVGFDDWPV
ncbi:uncharacterized protein FOMMEDRAFT_169492 [Fomitiporia mediterranea MF3/22]|uniref:uncharacterized protein n=1 Tax=Fomitiporia mediterranea (strain MF3/22) TaxID=694068 RepID=UPI0004407B37|nr:uncharacterized protein FOMMEDRAFT_169492 [Fomitiporia mediterranea MF3/22]EJD01354.1 hypothetical protein FOMMEDRAFT_169492 [Fomitiporia mediterranea MF3/22]